MISLTLVLLLAAGGNAFARTYTTLDVPGAALGTFASGVDGSNIVGSYYDSVGNEHGYLFNGSTYTTLDVPGAATGTTEARGISGNNIVGFSIDASTGNYHGFLYNGSSYTTLDDPLGTRTGTLPYAISGNNVVGEYGTTVGGGGQNNAFLYNGSSYTSLYVSPYLYQSNDKAYGISGNNIVGAYFDNPGPFGAEDLLWHGFVFDGSTYTTLDHPLAGNTVNSGEGTHALGISGNNIVGYYTDSSDTDHSFLYDGSSFTSLEVPGAAIGTTYASGISGNYIVGEFTDADGMEHGFLTQVPEPSSIALLSLGAIGVAAVALRGRRNRAVLDGSIAGGIGALCVLMEGRKLLNRTQWLGIAVAAASTLSATHLMAATYDAVTDFTAGNNPSGAWSYLFATSVGGSLTPLTAEPPVSVTPHVEAFGSQLAPPHRPLRGDGGGSAPTPPLAPITATRARVSLPPAASTPLMNNCL